MIKKIEKSVFKTLYVNYEFEIIENDENVEIEDIERELENFLWCDEPIEFPYSIDDEIELNIDGNKVVLKVIYVDADDEGIQIE